MPPKGMPSIRCLRGRIATSRASPQAVKPCNGGNWNAFRPVLKPNICCGKFSGDQFSDESIGQAADALRSEEHTPELQSLMRTSYAVFCLKKKQLHTEHQRSSFNISTQ